MTTTTTTTATATLFVPHAHQLEVFDPARNNGLVIVTTLAKGEVSVWQDGGRAAVVARKRHHVVYDPGTFVPVEIQWGYQKLTGAGWDWWGRMTAIATAIVKGGGGAIATTRGGGAVEMRAVVRKRDMAKLARLIFAIGVPSPIESFEDYLEGLGIAAGVAEYSSWTTDQEGDDSLKVVWVNRTGSLVIADTGGKPDRQFSAVWECDGRNVFVRETFADEHRQYDGGNNEPLAVLPAKWFENSGGTVEVRLGAYAEQVSGDGYDRKVTAYPEAIATIPVAKYDASAMGADYKY